MKWSDEVIEVSMKSRRHIVGRGQSGKESCEVECGKVGGEGKHGKDTHTHTHTHTHQLIGIVKFMTYATHYDA